MSDLYARRQMTVGRALSARAPLSKSAVISEPNSTPGGWRIGVDVGGTFTDVCLIEESTGRLAFWKVPSTPEDPSRGMLVGIREGLEQLEVSEDAVAYLAHGTTVATNMLLERRGAETAVLTTAGFRDQLEIARGRWPKMYDLQAKKPEPLVERHHCVGIPERTLYDGTIHEPLDEDAVRRAASDLSDQGVRAIAVCYLHAYANAKHEQRTAALIAEVAPEISVSLSSDVLCEQREYERLVTTVANAYLLPAMSQYLLALEEGVRGAGIAVEPLVNASSGGLLPISTAAEKPVLTILSGPSAGAVGAVSVGQACAQQSLITFDMGGTSTDVALINGGELPVVMEKSIGNLPLTVPTADVVTIGAGGGSIAFVDEGGLLKVGPESAGAVPGPACYGRGGTRPTVTDAMLVLGYLSERSLLAGRMEIDHDAARRAIDERVARPLGIEVEAAALGILAVARSSIEQAIRLVSVDRGFDPRDFALVAYGGAGPQHAAAVATSLSIRRVIVPTSPGTLCALGLLVSDIRIDYSRTVYIPANASAEATLSDGFVELISAANVWFDANRIPVESREARQSVDVRYVGQHHQITVPLPADFAGTASWSELDEAFARDHRRLYGHSSDNPTEIVALRVAAIGHVARDGASTGESASESVTNGTAHAPRFVQFDLERGPITTDVYEREDLVPGRAVVGPCIIEQMDTTTIILPGQVATGDRHGNIVIELEPAVGATVNT